MCKNEVLEEAPAEKLHHPRVSAPDDSVSLATTPELMQSNKTLRYGTLFTNTKRSTTVSQSTQ